MECPICGCSDVRFVQRNKRSTPAFTEYICNGCLGFVRVSEADSTILNTEQIKKAREELARRGYAQPDIVCNGYPSGTAAEAHGFTERGRSWLTENVKAGHWMVQGQSVQVLMQEARDIVSRASAAGLHVETNNV